MIIISGNLVDIENRCISKCSLYINANGIIEKIQETDNVPDQYILPGFIDAHIHIESSMVTPYEFAKKAIIHGTVATVSDPHEIANVCGIDGIKYMIDNARDAKLKFFWGAPSCVPATSFENAGAAINAEQVDNLMQSDDIWYLSEMMNYPGVLYGDEEVFNKIQSAKKYGKPIDGHAPGLRGDDIKKYISFGISTEHECYTLDEALEKVNLGMKIIIREGSAAKNYDALHSLIHTHTSQTMFCSDDKHPNDLQLGHINTLVKKSLALGYDLFDVLQIACINPIEHYKIPVGRLLTGDPADFIIIDNPNDFNVLETYINGECVAKNGKSLLPKKTHSHINNFNAGIIDDAYLKVKGSDSEHPVIVAIDTMLITEKSYFKLPQTAGYTVCDPINDILKICVVNRYQDQKIAVGFIKNFGLKGCAIASTVAHDSHNIVAVGDDDILLAKAINLLIESKGGLSAVSHHTSKHIALPIAGLMSDMPVEIIGSQYEEISNFAKHHGSTLEAPYMTLSFMALLVIPKIKISDLGMFDAEKFEFYE